MHFVHHDKEYEVLFNTTGKAGGKISVIKSGQKLLEENFTEEMKSPDSES